MKDVDDPRPWILYLRVSDDDQVLGVSLDAQLDSGRHYAKARGWTIAHEIQDPGYSGKDLTRPGIKQALTLLKTGEIAGIIVWKLERLTRRLRDLLFIRDLLMEQNLSLVSISENVDTSSPAGRLFLSMLGSFNEYDRENISSRIASAMQYAKTQGYWIGGHIPPGTKVVPDGNRRRLVPNEHADAVRKCWGLAMKGDGMIAIGRHLTDAGVPPPGHVGVESKQGGWTPKAVWNLLRSRQVVGILVEPALQLQVIATLGNRASPRRKGNTRPIGSIAHQPSALSGLVRCPTCGAAMCHAVSRGRGGYYRYFRCTVANKNRQTCGQRDLRCEPLEQAVLIGLKGIAQPDGPYHQELQRQMGTVQRDRQEARQRRAQLTAEREQLTARLGDLAMVGPRPGTAAFNALLKPLASRLEVLDHQLGAAIGAAAVAEVDDLDLDEAIGTITRQIDGLQDLPADQQNRKLRILVQQVRIEGSQVRLTLYRPKAHSLGVTPGPFRAEAVFGTPKGI